MFEKFDFMLLNVNCLTYLTFEVDILVKHKQTNLVYFLN